MSILVHDEGSYVLDLINVMHEIRRSTSCDIVLHFMDPGHLYVVSLGRGAAQIHAPPSYCLVRGVGRGPGNLKRKDKDLSGERFPTGHVPFSDRSQCGGLLNSSGKTLECAI